MKLMKKGQTSVAQAFIMGIAGIAITVAVVMIVLAELQDNAGNSACSGYYNSETNVCQVNSTNTTALSAPTAAENATGSMITKVAGIPTWVGLLIVTFFAGLVLLYFYMRQ
jgi:type IV secretory pathway protease TraF